MRRWRKVRGSEGRWGYRDKGRWKRREAAFTGGNEGREERVELAGMARTPKSERDLSKEK
jgi:hypothetical protein